MDRIVRSIIKATTWRGVASLYTGIVAFALTQSFSIATTVMGGEVLVKFFLYLIHERVWAQIRWGRMKNGGAIIWMTGLPSSGKTTLAEKIQKPLEQAGKKVQLLDGDVMRGMFPNTGFSKEDRDNHIRRVGYMASLLAKHGVFVVCSFVSPYKETRQQVREMFSDGFVEVFVDCPVEKCIERDVKGLYAKALAGEIKQFTGIDDPYEAPNNPDIHLKTDELNEQECVQIMLDKIIGIWR